MGILIEDTDLDGAREAYRQAIASGHADAAPRAAYYLGQLLGGHGDRDGARAAYRQAFLLGTPR